MNTYLSTLHSPWPSLYAIGEPNRRVVVATDIDAIKFQRRAKLAGYFKFNYPVGEDTKTYDSRGWWEDGMGSEVCHTIHILTDNPDEGVYCGFCYLNHPDYFMLLGKLVDGDSFTEEYREILRSHEL